MRDYDLLYLEKYLSKEKLQQGKKLLEKGIAPQYIVGNVEFYGIILNVNPNVLIPRFETELLVEKTIHYVKQFWRKDDSNFKILDIGTGSGCIAIALKKELNCDVTGIDISNEALDVARSNAIENQVDIHFIQSDIFSDVNDTFDIIISNPPYIRCDEEIMDVVKNNEPSIALYGGDDGLYFYDKILSSVSNYLNEKSIIAFEIGSLQASSITLLANKYLSNSKVIVKKDLSGFDRFIFILNGIKE